MTKNSLVATSKPRIESNIEPYLKDLLIFFKEHQQIGQTQRYSESRAIEEACIAFFGIGEERLKKISRLAKADSRQVGDYVRLLLQRIIDEIEE